MSDINPSSLEETSCHYLTVEHVDTFFSDYNEAWKDGRGAVILWATDVCQKKPHRLFGLNESVANNDPDIREILKTAADLFDIESPETQQCALMIYRSWLAFDGLSHVTPELESCSQHNILAATAIPNLSLLACSLVPLLPCEQVLVNAIYVKPLSTRQKIMKACARIIEKRRVTQSQRDNARQLLSALYVGCSDLPPLFWLHLCSEEDVTKIFNRVRDAHRLCKSKALLFGQLLTGIRWKRMWQCHEKTLTNFFASLSLDELQNGNYFPDDCPQATDALLLLLPCHGKEATQLLLHRPVTLNSFMSISATVFARKDLTLCTPEASEWSKIMQAPPRARQLVMNADYNQLWKVVPKLFGAKRLKSDQEVMNVCLQVHSDMCDSMLELYTQIFKNADTVVPKWFDPHRFINHCGRFDQAALAAMHSLTVKHWGRRWFMDRYFGAIHRSFAVKRIMVNNKTGACPPIHWGNVHVIFLQQKAKEKQEESLKACLSFLDDVQDVISDAKVIRMWRGVSVALSSKHSNVSGILQAWLQEADLKDLADTMDVTKEKAKNSVSFLSWIFHN